MNDVVIPKGEIVEKNPEGRPWFNGMNEQMVVAKLKEAWECGAPDVEAALNAQVSKSSVSRYLKAHPLLAKLRDELRESPSWQARHNITKSVKKGNIEDSKWYLERKQKKEFSSRQEQTGADGESLAINVINFNVLPPKQKVKQLEGFSFETIDVELEPTTNKLLDKET